MHSNFQMWKIAFANDRGNKIFLKSKSKKKRLMRILLLNFFPSPEAS